MGRKIGVLALQGDFARHLDMLEKLGTKVVAVKRPEQLEGCHGLIIPGGETTTLTRLLNTYNFYKPLRKFAQKFPVMGTCAGAILLAREVDDPRVEPLGLMHVSVRRNAYGRQVDSFIADIDASALGGPATFRAVFIRAPKIVAAGNGVETLMTCEAEPVMVKEKRFLAVTFHPELTSDPRVHRYFLKMAGD